VGLALARPTLPEVQAGFGGGWDEPREGGTSLGESHAVCSRRSAGDVEFAELAHRFLDAQEWLG
jgi:hypothetical protein